MLTAPTSLVELGLAIRGDWHLHWDFARPSLGPADHFEDYLGQVGPLISGAFATSSATVVPSSWMSEEKSLKLEVALLRSEVAGLQARVAELERVRGGSSSPHSFQLITEAETPQEAETPACAFEVAAADAESRLALAKEIGKFLRRAVTGQPRGSSGRDRLKLQNRCYLVVADFEGKALAEPKFLTSFQEVKAICKRGSEAGDSVFVGLPTKWEARAALIAGDFPLPAALRNA